MSKRIEYNKGDFIGKAGLIYLKENHNNNSKRFIDILCTCNKIFVANLGNIRSGNTNSCGHLQKENGKKLGLSNIKHGLEKHPFYDKHRNMMKRVYDSTSPEYYLYKNRLVEPFLQDIKNFILYIESLPRAYEKGLTLDRIDNNKGYQRGNLRWASYALQAANRKNSSLYTGISKPDDYVSYKATIYTNKKEYNLGLYSTIKKAVEARNAFITENNLPHPLQTYKENDVNYNK